MYVNARVYRTDERIITDIFVVQCTAYINMWSMSIMLWCAWTRACVCVSVRGSRSKEKKGEKRIKSPHTRIQRIRPFPFIVPRYPNRTIQNVTHCNCMNQCCHRLCCRRQLTTVPRYKKFHYIGQTQRELNSTHSHTRALHRPHRQMKCVMCNRMIGNAHCIFSHFYSFYRRRRRRMGSHCDSVVYVCRASTTMLLWDIAVTCAPSSFILAVRTHTQFAVYSNSYMYLYVNKWTSARADCERLQMKIPPIVWV